ncbi:MAG TPA: hypothetical protein ENI42_07015 [Thermoplasmatales archaeon]|nr:hypothetical protein [Thermoplasmatales archaeon]
MNNIGSTGIITVPLLSSLLVFSAASTNIFENSDNLSKDVEKMVNDVVEEVATYIVIKDAIGKYYHNADGVPKVRKIVVLVKPLIPSVINISELTIEISNGNDVMLLSYSGKAMQSNSAALFEHQIWDKTVDAFSLIVLIDKDKSLLDHGIMNEDLALIAIRLPDKFAMGDDESITLSIIPVRGAITSVVLETLFFHSSNVVSLGC